MNIRKFKPGDWKEIWPLLKIVFSAGETYAIDRNIQEKEAKRIWVEYPMETFIAEVDDKIVGTYYLKQNQPGGGSHVCNCGYIVSPESQGKGVGRALCEHSIYIAGKYGFKAMQFNFVVSSNVGAVELWKKMGFTIAGTLPGAFNHPRLGMIDAYIMYRHLV